MPDLKPQNNFVSPYPQPELNCELGLTSLDIARAIDVNHKNVAQKIIRYKREGLFDEMGWHLASFEDKRPNQPGRRQKHYSMNTRAAKAVVARYNNRAGLGYLNYLFDCEEIVEKKVPELLKKNAELQEQVRELTRPTVKRKNSGYMITTKTPIITYDLFNEPRCVVHKEKKAFTELSELELERYRIQHRQRVIRGLTEKQTSSITEDNVSLFLLPDKRN